MIVRVETAGVETARVADLRGYDVHLYDKQPKIGEYSLIAAMENGFDRENLPMIYNCFNRPSTENLYNWV